MLAWLGAVAVELAGAPTARAGQSRAEEIAAAQAKKAEQLRPYTPTKPELILEFVERRLLDPPPITMTYDSVYSGGGFTLGGQFRQFYRDRSIWAIRGLYSFKNYKLFEVVTTSPGHWLGRLDLTARAGWRDATQVGYYGLGIDTPPEARTSYRFEQTFAEGRAALRAPSWVSATGQLSYEHFALRSGQGDTPSIETLYTPATAPGLGDSPTFVRTALTAGIETRPAPRYARSGGYYGVGYENYADVDDTYSFDRLDVDLIHHVPVLRETWVISMHGRVQTTLGDDLVPYFLLPSLGGGSSLRAYSSWRFRDRHAWLGTIEWRWIPNRLGMDMALFYDTGKVAARREDLTFDNRASNWGVGVRFHALQVTALRIELARGSEGWHLVFASGASF